jgi:LCP family protein required for cell wall assembly
MVRCGPGCYAVGEGLLIGGKTDAEHERRAAAGRRLQEAREERGISLRDAEQALRFHAHQLEAVERGDYEALPSVIWAEGILTAYGNYLGLDGQELARQLFPLRRMPKIKRSLRRRWRVLVVLASMLGVAAFIVGAVIFAPYNPITDGVADALEKAAPGTFLGSEPQRVAVFGDAGGTINGADNIVVAEVEEEGLGLLFVPGDTPARIPGHDGRGDVGDVLAMERPDLTRQTVSGLTEAEVQHHVLVSTNGVREITEAMGGVMVDVPRQVSVRASPEQAAIMLTPGPQKLDGDQAIAYLRGDDLQTDAQIAKRQQTFLYAMFRQALGPSNLLANPGTVGVVSENVETNMSSIQMSQLAGRVVHLQGTREPPKMSNANDL